MTTTTTTTRLAFRTAQKCVSARLISCKSFHTFSTTLSHHAGPSIDKPNQRKPITIHDLNKLYRSKTPITVLTAHDYISGKIAEEAGVDVVLVGDSLGMVALGYESTNEMELQDMVHHSKAVRRGVKTPFLIADLPFGSYETSPDQALTSAMTMVKQARIDAVKLEGGQEYFETVQKLTSRGIPVIGHIGLTPQRQAMLGGFKVQGKTVESAESILDDAFALQAAGCFALIIEAVPAPIAEIVTKHLKIPTIGIGAGPKTSGQVLVQLDMLGGFDGFTPKFLKKYSNYLDINTKACAQYAKEVRSGEFPEQKHCYTIKDDQLELFNQLLKSDKYNLDPFKKD